MARCLGGGGSALFDLVTPVLQGRPGPTPRLGLLRSGWRRVLAAVALVLAILCVSVAVQPDGLRLVWLDLNRLFAVQQMPVILGRSPQASFCVDDSRVSRSHARVDWHSGNFQLTDLSYNGTYVRFTDGEMFVEPAVRRWPTGAGALVEVDVTPRREVLPLLGGAL